MGYLHIEIEAVQNSKHPDKPCGDVVHWERRNENTYIIVSDGLGHGIKANIAATMCVARLKELMATDFSLRRAFTSLVKTMNHAAKNGLPYAVFTVARIMKDGGTTVLTYDMPAPIFMTPSYSNVLPQRTYTVENAVIGESNCFMKPREALVIVSDGITQAGLGRGLRMGWESAGLNRYINERLNERMHYMELPASINQKAHELCKGHYDDDTTSLVAWGRDGTTVNILSGPPSNKMLDHDCIHKFIELDGTKIVCGASTAKIVAQVTGKSIELEGDLHDELTPPISKIDGIDLVTEGAITLNQVYNIWDEDRVLMDDNNSAVKLLDAIQFADKIRFMVGTSQNPATKDIKFKQQGLLTRMKIIPLIANKCKADGKQVLMQYY